MKRFLIVVAAFLIYFNATAASIPATIPVENSSLATPGNSGYILSKISALKIKQVEKLLGRKLKLKEKIAFKVYQWKAKKGLLNKKTDKPQKGKTAMILGIIGLGLIFIPYVSLAAIPCAVLAIVFGNQARKENPEDGKAKAGVILGWVTIGIFIIVLAIVIAILSTFTWGWG
jgi:hypothetical protein